MNVEDRWKQLFPAHSVCGIACPACNQTTAEREVAARDLALATVDDCQRLADPQGAERCNSACDCPYGLLRARIAVLPAGEGGG